MKTIEEAIEYELKMFRQSRNKDKYEDSLIFKMERWIKEAFKYGVDFSQRWISIKENYPPDREMVLAKYKRIGANFYMVVMWHPQLNKFLIIGTESDEAETPDSWRKIELT